ncbi:MAG: hypothetical protein ISR69_10065 [Gammaproteobacteria bacterium]|nr:hypothetical protein [Gammaproteobacteria bacterium]
MNISLGMQESPSGMSEQGETGSAVWVNSWCDFTEVSRRHNSQTPIVMVWTRCQQQAL